MAESLGARLSAIISDKLPDTPENNAFCSNEGKYKEKGFYEMMTEVMDAIEDHIGKY